MIGQEQCHGTKERPGPVDCQARELENIVVRWHRHVVSGLYHAAQLSRVVSEAPKQCVQHGAPLPPKPNQSTAQPAPLQVVIVSVNGSSLLPLGPGLNTFTSSLTPCFLLSLFCFYF